MIDQNVAIEDAHECCRLDVCISKRATPFCTYLVEFGVKGIQGLAASPGTTRSLKHAVYVTAFLTSYVSIQDGDKDMMLSRIRPFA